MSIPAVNITVLDGGIGTIQPSNAKTQAKIGVCQNGTASVAAHVDIASTTGGDKVTFTAVAAGAQGNQISIQYAAPSGGTTSVSVVGNSILVSPKSGATNTDIVNAINASPAALLVTPVATGGSDLVVTTAATNLAGGVTGTINTIIPITGPQQALTALGYGPLADAVSYSLQNSAGLVYAVPVNPSIAGGLSGVAHVGTGPAISVSGSPYDSYNVIVTITKGGVLRTAQFQYTLDGGIHTQPVVTTPGGGSYVLPNTGITLTLASGTYLAGETYSFGSTAPGYGSSDVTNAFAALLASPNSWNFAHLVGAADTVAHSATIATTVDGIMAAAALAYRYTFGVVECPSDTDANIISGYAAFVSARTMVCVGTGTTFCPASGLSLNRSSGFAITARMALVSVATDLGQFNIGPLPQVTAIQRDERVTPQLDALGFSTLGTFQGQAGFYITGGHMKVAQTSDFFNVQNRRVMDQACAQTYASLLYFLNSPLLANKTNGTIAETSAQNVEGKVGNELAQAIVAPGFCSGSSVVVDRNNNVLGTNTLNVTTSIIPLAYAKTINETITFTNPGLQVSPGQ